MSNYNFTRRSKINSSSVYDHADNVIILSVGSAYPPLLPDVPQRHQMQRETEDRSTQYGPLMGLDEFRETIQAFVMKTILYVAKPTF